MTARTTWSAFQQRAQELNFEMSSEDATGHLLTTLAASKPGGHFLELGTGVGLGSARLLSGMDRTSRLDTVELDPILSKTARSLIGDDARVTFHVADGSTWLAEHADQRYAFIFADAWPGKFSDLDARADLHCTALDWASGLMLCVRKHDS